MDKVNTSRSQLNELEKLPCHDFLAFQDLLLKSRKVDDNITNLLNTILPTDSFICEKNQTSKQCEKLWHQLLQTYNKRELAIKKCITQVSDNILKIKKQNELNDNLILNNNLKKEQRKLRILQSELNVEEVVRDRSTKLFKEKCRNYYSS